MSARTIVIVLLGAVVIGGCRKDAAPSTPADKQSGAAAPVRPPAEKEITLRIRKLGGEDGKQEMNRLTVTTPIGDDFTITEQVGTTQLQFRGVVTAVGNAMFQVVSEYVETSDQGVKQFTGRIQVEPDKETDLGGLQGAAGLERVTITVSRS